MRFASYAVCMVGVVVSVAAELYVTHRWASFGWHTATQTLLVISPFVLTAAVVHAVRRFRLPSAGALLFSVALTLWSGWSYPSVRVPDSLPFFTLGFTPLLQLFCVVAFLSPVLAGALFIHHRHDTTDRNA